MGPGGAQKISAVKGGFFGVAALWRKPELIEIAVPHLAEATAKPLAPKRLHSTVWSKVASFELLQVVMFFPIKNQYRIEIQSSVVCS